MSEQNKTHETQQERWLKYGTNVVLASLVVILLAGAVTYLAQRFNRRLDTTAGGLYSLKPQTINIIQNNQSPIKLYSLYTRANPGAGGVDDEAGISDFAQPVADLLEEYKRKGRNIDVEIIDPVSQPAKVDGLIEEVTAKYGGEVKKYKAVVDEFPGIYEQITKLAAEEVKQVDTLPLEKVESPEHKQTLILTLATIQGVPRFLEKTKDGVERRLKQKPPDYKGATNSIQDGMSLLSQMTGRIIEDFGKAKDDAKVPEQIRNYMADSSARYEQIKKLADDVDKRIKELGDLKLDDLRQSLRARDAILVAGPDDMRVIPFEKVWQVPEDVRGFTAEGKPKPRFAGEQQVTSAILAVTAKVKPKVVFVRPGGSPLTMPGIPGFQRGGPLSQIAEKLREYNFEVMEKDLTGMWEMQARMQQMPSMPEPTEEQIKDAVWIVLGVPAGRSMMGPPPTIAPKVADHLKNGGSAMVLVMPNSEPLDAALGDWGVKVRTDVIAVHEAVKGGVSSADMIEEAMRIPFVFVLKEYGDHPITRPLRSLDGVLVPMLPVEVEQKQGYKAASILPVPQTLKVWGESNVEAALRGDPVTYDPPKGASRDGDMSPPISSGAVVEKEGGGRLVVIGSAEFAMNHILNIYEPNLARQGILVSRFPGNTELMVNSVLWLARQEPMIAISPSALEVSRVREMSPGVLRFWRVGVLLVGLPLLVVVAGVMVYVSRRD